MTRPRNLAVIMGLTAAGAAAVAVVRHWSSSGGHALEGGVAMDDARSYDRMSRLLLGSLFEGIAHSVAATARPGARVLEVGCGPGHLSLRLARDHGLTVTAIDLDPMMIERARANALRESRDAEPHAAAPRFEVGDVGELDYPAASFDLVVSTMSMHHWADPAGGMAEIARVMRPGGHALIWDLRAGGLPFHRQVSDPASYASVAGLLLLSDAPWRWPGPLALTRRVEFLREPDA